MSCVGTVYICVSDCVYHCVCVCLIFVFHSVPESLPPSPFHSSQRHNHFSLSDSDDPVAQTLYKMFEPDDKVRVGGCDRVRVGVCEDVMVCEVVSM